ncbi:hypothetical protein CLAIMM_09728 [Cladophialophora immunda]|nr:hypothetical protein CLAIMM_09728 [Cladophialophora immunda]
MIYSFCIAVLFSTCVYASPIALPQAVTAVISPSQPPPPGCTGTFPGVFGIALMNVSLPVAASVSDSSATAAAAGRLRGRQEAPAPILTMGSVSQIGDGQVQGGMHTAAITVVTPVAPVSQIGDGQIQGPVVPVVPDIATVVSTPASSVAPTSNVPVPFPPQGSSPSATPSKPPTVLEQACGISARPNPSPAVPLPSSPSLQTSIPTQASPISASLTATTTTTVSPAATPSPPPPRLSLVSCLTNSTLRLHLADHDLTDAFNRTGYIASNYQFQFDGPPQSGAIWTSGWSICPVVVDNTTTAPNSTAVQGLGDSDDADGGIRTLALGGSTTFWQCLSGDFYNLYTENWAAQCSPVELRIVSLVDCGQ